MRILGRVFAVVLSVVLSAAAAVTLARVVLLPDAACAVSQRAVDNLKLEIGYDRVREALGCDGVLASREVWSPELRREVYHWRGDAWPFGRFDGLFYNGVLHGKDVRWITVNIGLTPAVADAPAAPPSAPPPKP